MTPGEVASLQALAQQHGGSLSINPQTGLPEAGFLSALLPMAAGAGLAAMGMPAGYAALSVGAASAATNGGDMKKAILNGFSAYTGAGLADSFMGAGAAMQSGTATSWMGGEAPVTAAAPTIEVAPSAGNLAGASQQEAINQAGMYRGPSYAAEASNVSLASAAPAEVAQAAAATTPAAQAAQQAASLDTMNMSQRFDALKAGASGTNAMNYIKANPFASLGTATAMLTPDENKTPQKAADTDRGPRAGLSYYPGWSSPLPKPNMQGVEQTYNRPYYAAKGGVTRMATGGITSAPRNQQQLFAEYLQRVSNSGTAATPPTNKYDWWKSGGGSDTSATPSTETPEQYAARMSLNARGGGGGRGEREPEDPNSFSAQWAAMSDAEKEAFRLENPKTAAAQDLAMLIGSPFMFAYNKLQEYMGPESSTGGPARFARTPVVPNENDEPGDRYAPAYSPTLSPSSLDPSQQAKALAGYTSAQFSGVEPAPQATPFGNFYDAPLSSRTDVSGYPLRESELKSLERGLAPTSAQVKKGDPFAGFFNSDPTLNQIAKYADPSRQDPKFFPAGTAYTDKQFFRDSYGNLFAPGDAIPAGTTASGNMALADQNKLQGLAQQRAVDASKPTVPDFTAISQADEAKEKAEQAQQRAVEDRQKVVAQLGYMNNTLAQYPNALEGDKGLVFIDKYASLENQLNNLDSAYGDRFTPNDPHELNQNSIEKFQQAKENLEPGDRFAPVNYSNQFLSPEAYQTEVDKANANITPDIVGVNEISADPDADKTAESLGIPSAETFAAMIGAPIGQYAAIDNGVVSDAGVLGGYNPSFGAPTTTSSGRGLAGLTASFGGLGSAWQGVVDRNGNPVLTSQGAAEKAFLGSPEGIQAANTEAYKTYTPPQDPAQRAESARQEAQAQQDARIAAFDASREGSRGGGGGMGGGDGGGAVSGGGGSLGNQSSDTRAALRSNEGYGGPSDARGGYLQHGKFDQRMAYGGLSAMPNPYDLGSYSDGVRLLKGPGDGVSDSIPATSGKGRPARLADGEFVIPARIVSEIGNGSTDAGARKLYAMMDRIQAGRKKSVGKGKVAVNSRAYKHLPA